MMKAYPVAEAAAEAAAEVVEAQSVAETAEPVEVQSFPQFALHAYARQ